METAAIVGMIGIVNMYHNTKYLDKVVEAAHGLGHRVTIVNGYHLTRSEVYSTIRDSRIGHWIFTGGDHYVDDLGANQVPLEVLSLPKRFLMICYSMESVLWQLGFPLVHRDHVEKGYFKLDVGGRMLTLYRLHRCYIRPKRAQVTVDGQMFRVRTLAVHEKELMMATIGPALLTQFHPESSRDGRQLLKAWLAER
jgi:GMP synthase-like glutamine amidotransferase